MLKILDLAGAYPEIALAVLSGLMAVAGWIGSRLAFHLGQGWMATLLYSAGRIVDSIVADVGQTLVDDIKAAREDGKLTEQEAAEALARAWDLALEHLPWRQLSRGLGGRKAAESWARTEIEAAVDRRKAAKAVLDPTARSRSTT